jgi:hypothetical protein
MVDIKMSRTNMAVSALQTGKTHTVETSAEMTVLTGLTTGWYKRTSPRGRIHRDSNRERHYKVDLHNVKGQADLSNI